MTDRTNRPLDGDKPANPIMFSWLDDQAAPDERTPRPDHPPHKQDDTGKPPPQPPPFYYAPQVPSPALYIGDPHPPRRGLSDSAAYTHSGRYIDVSSQGLSTSAYEGSAPHPHYSETLSSIHPGAPYLNRTSRYLELAEQPGPAFAEPPPAPQQTYAAPGDLSSGTYFAPPPWPGLLTLSDLTSPPGTSRTSPNMSTSGDDEVDAPEAGEGLFPCSQCHMSFPTRPQYAFHVRRIHQLSTRVTYRNGIHVTLKRDPETNVFYCYCGQASEYPSSISRHAHTHNYELTPPTESTHNPVSPSGSAISKRRRRPSQARSPVPPRRN